MGSQSMGGKEETLCHDHGLLRNHHFIHPGPSSVHCTAFHCISSIPAAHVYNVCSVFHCISTIPVTEVYNVRSVFHCISSTPATKVYDVLCSTVIHPTQPNPPRQLEDFTAVHNFMLQYISLSRTFTELHCTAENV